MEARPCSDTYDDEQWEVASAFRVTIWEQPARRAESEQERPQRGRFRYASLPGAPMGWSQISFELVGAQDVREAIDWAEAALAAGEGPESRRGRSVDDREYMVYAKIGNENRWLHVAGWNPVVGHGPPLNLRRLERP